MDKFEAIRNKFKTLPGAMQEIVAQSFAENDSIIEDMNIAQLEKGQRGDGTMLPDYSIGSVKVYGKPPGPMNLRDTGDFHRGITLTAGADAATLAGKDNKTEMLEDRYGDEIIKIQDENKEVIKSDYLKPSIGERIKKHFE